MKIKRFVAKDMRTALQEVKEFLGPDAIILSNKKVAEGVEIVAALDPQPAPAAKPAAPVAAPVPRFSARVDDDNTEEPADSLKALLARQMIKQQVAQPQRGAVELAQLFPADAEEPAERQLLALELPAAALHELARVLDDTLDLEHEAVVALVGVVFPEPMRRNRHPHVLTQRLGLDRGHRRSEIGHVQFAAEILRNARLDEIDDQQRRAPPGLPLRPIEIPPPIDPGSDPA